MGQEEKQIAELIAEIAHKRDHMLRFPVMSGITVAGSVDDAAMTVSVVLSVDDDSAPTEDILLNAVLNNMGGVYMLPTDGAKCIVAEIDGPGKWQMLWADSYTKVVIQASSLIQFNDGSLGALPKGPALQTQINKLNTLVSHLVTIITGPTIDEPGSGAPSALQVALAAAILTDEVGDFNDILNDNIRQG